MGTAKCSWLGCVLLALALGASPGHGQGVDTQDFLLQDGWNAIFLEVDPLDAANSPATVFATTAQIEFERVARWIREDEGVQFIDDPDELVPQLPEWLFYFGEENIPSNLQTIDGGYPYLVKVNLLTANPEEAWSATGTPTLRTPQWQPGRYTLTGFYLSEMPPAPTFQSFFAASSIHAGQHIYRLSTTGKWELVAQPAIDTMRKGEAYWVFTRDNGSGDDLYFSGPMRIILEQGNRLEYGSILDEQAITIQNVTTQVRTITVTPSASMTVPQPPEVPLSFWNQDFETENVGWDPLTNNPALQLTVPALGESRLRLAVRRIEMDLPGIEDYQSLLNVSDGTMDVTIPVSATGSGDGTLDRVGLWVGTAVLSGVSEHVESAGPTEPRAAGAEFQLRLVLHVREDGAARLLKQVVQVWDPPVYNDADDDGINEVITPGRFLLFTDNDDLKMKLDELRMANVEPVGRRVSSVGFSFDTPLGLGLFPVVKDADRDGLLDGYPTFEQLTDPESPASLVDPLAALTVVGINDPLNPFTHRFHPDHNGRDNGGVRFGWRDRVLELTEQSMIALSLTSIPLDDEEGMADDNPDDFRDIVRAYTFFYHPERSLSNAADISFFNTITKSLYEDTEKDNDANTELDLSTEVTDTPGARPDPGTEAMIFADADPPTVSEQVEVPEVTRAITLGFSADDPEGLNRIDWGRTRVGGVYREEIGGLVNETISVEGYFTLQHISDTNALATDDEDDPVVTITIANGMTSPVSPFPTSDPVLMLAGTATDSAGVEGIDLVTWRSDRGGVGVAAGLTAWTIADIALEPGDNLITVSARDIYGNVGTAQLTVAYTPCTFVLTPMNQNFVQAGGNGSFDVMADIDCSWEALSGAPSWLHITPPTAIVTGNGTVDYTVDSNPGAARGSFITVGDQTFTVTQDGTMAPVTIVTDVAMLNVPEGGMAGFQVKLSAQPATGVTVGVAYLSGDTDISVFSGATLVFTTVNWDTFQPVQLTAAEDADTANGIATIRCSSAGLADVDVTATETDNDAVAIMTDVAALNVPEGGMANFQVRLTAEPAGNVTVSVARESGDTDISVTAGGTLVFTTGDWDTYQQVTLAAAQDVDTLHSTANIRCSAPGLANVDVTATETDDDTLMIQTDFASANVPEGGSGGFMVRLGAQPVGTVTVNVARDSGDTDITVSSGSSLMFSNANWNVFQPVGLAAAEDDDAANGAATIRCSSAGMADVDVTANEVDNDTLGIMTDLTSVNVTEGLSAQFQVRLTAQPLSNVTVTVERFSGDTDLAVSPVTPLILTFTMGNWNTYQPVTVAAAEDADSTNGSAVIRASSAGLNNADVTANEADNDVAPFITITFPLDTGNPPFSKAVAFPGYNITWNSGGFAGNVIITLRRNTAMIVLSGAGGTANDGTFDWIPASNVPINTNYYIEIKSFDMQTIVDTSGFFQVTN